MSSKRWKERQFSDPYVKRAQKEGFVCRAAYKLMEIDDKFKLLRSGMTVVDLGAAPGGWCQVASKRVGKQGRVIGMDLLPLKAPVSIDFIQGDFREAAQFEALMTMTGGQVDAVISDMSPNLTGHKSTDQVSVIALVEMALDFAVKVLRSRGGFCAKVFQGAGFEELVKTMRPCFEQVKIFKPKSSRSESAEVYLVGVNFRAR